MQVHDQAIERLFKEGLSVTLIAARIGSYSSYVRSRLISMKLIEPKKRDRDG